ncbi:MAG: transporter [Deltaproteobacteria bacterium]|jgi:hypothetical protein|nr:transporter [Deltaproteobacteria bacterium]
MKKIASRLILPFPLLLLCLALAQQTEAANDDELQRQLLARDKVILDLLERVEVLERRVGVQRTTPGPVNSPESNEKIVQNSTLTPGAVVVEEGAAERALELSLTREGALLLLPGILNVETRLTYTRQEDKTPTFISLDNNLIAGETEVNANSLTADLQLRLGLPWESQLEIGVPYQWRNVEFVSNANFSPIDKSSQSGSGLGDLRVGLAKTLSKEKLDWPDLIGRITWDTDTGSVDANGVPLGGGFNELRGSLTAIKRQDPVAFVGELSYEYTFEDNEIQPGSVISSILGGNIALNPETSLGLFFGAAYQNELKLNGSRIEGSDRTIGTFQLGGSTLLARGTLFNLSGGIGLTDDADDFSISISLTKRFPAPLF